MIVQGTTGTGKSFIIHCIRQNLNVSTAIQENPLLVLAPTGVAAYNIQGTTLHAGLRIPIKEMHPLTSQALFTSQEHFRHVKYILIDEIRFLGPKLLLKIDNRLRKAFPNKQHERFGGLSIILIGDLGQLPPVMDKPVYASHSTTLILWHSFKIVVTLHIVFRHQGVSIKQQHFRSLLQNIRDAQPNKHDWQFLMNQTNTNLIVQQQKEFNSSIHLFATNESARLHNKRMLKELNFPIALSLAHIAQPTNTDYDNDEQLPLELLLCVNQQVMLLANLWTEVGLVNGSIGLVKKIIYENNTRPPDLPRFVIVQFQNYKGPPWDTLHPNDIPITPITRGRRTQIPLTMAWAITIHKSQGLTLDKATIDIGNSEKKGLTFTTISRIKTIDGIRIHSPFSFERYAKMQKSVFPTIRKKEEARL
ncbi:ATP-dependent DNA helicase PIF1-like [Cryptomeria japonica]|uniref:ATP-dependent DNA helicase PIF1-like n=1 Tax=Cryptomeria japonica TaxID=3369 RepID=UPI0027DA4E36|nr:ATP-dependent DNA helicase PIF1-like [Cryptomeria japonica]